MNIKRNAPYILGFRAIAYALAGGNTTILKGPELSPRCFWAIGDIFRKAGLPDGCLNVLSIQAQDAAEVVTAMIEHPAVKKINYTGSTAIGSIVAATAGKNLKPVLMELGGKASAIVLEDADLEKAAEGCAMGAFTHVSHFTSPPLLKPPMNESPNLNPIHPERPSLHVHRTHNRPLLHRSRLLQRAKIRNPKTLLRSRPLPYPRHLRQRYQKQEIGQPSPVQRSENRRRRHKHHGGDRDANAANCGRGDHERHGSVLRRIVRPHRIPDGRRYRGRSSSASKRHGIRSFLRRIHDQSSLGLESGQTNRIRVTYSLLVPSCNAPRLFLFPFIRLSYAALTWTTAPSTSTA